MHTRVPFLGVEMYDPPMENNGPFTALLNMEAPIQF